MKTDKKNRIDIDGTNVNSSISSHLKGISHCSSRGKQLLLDFRNRKSKNHNAIQPGRLHFQAEVEYSLLLENEFRRFFVSPFGFSQCRLE